MSRFIDTLNQISNALPQRIGFRSTAAVSVKPRLLLVAGLTDSTLKGLANCVNGADAGLIYVAGATSEAARFKKVGKSIIDIPWGIGLKESVEIHIEKIVEAGCDFVIFPTATALRTVTQHEKVGTILEVDASLSDILLKAVDGLSVDAVLVDCEHEHGLTWYHLMLVRRFAALMTKPLLALIPPDTDGMELMQLWEAGVDGVIVEAGEGKSAGRIGDLRRIIDGLQFPSRRRHRKSEPLVSYPGVSSQGTDNGEDDDEE